MVARQTNFPCDDHIGRRRNAQRSLRALTSTACRAHRTCASIARQSSGSSGRHTHGNSNLCKREREKLTAKTTLKRGHCRIFWCTMQIAGFSFISTSATWEDKTATPFVSSSDSGAPEAACAESVSDVDHTRRSGVVTEFFGVSSRSQGSVPSAILPPGKSERLYRKIVPSSDSGAPEHGCDVNVSDAEDVRGRCQRLPTTNRRLSRTQEAAVPPETTGRRSMTSEPTPTAFMKSSCAQQFEAHVNAYTTGGTPRVSRG